MGKVSGTTHRIAILDDETVLCEAIKGLLQREENLVVGGTAITQTDAVELTREIPPKKDSSQRVC